MRQEVEAGTYSSGELRVHVDSLPNAKRFIRLGEGTPSEVFKPLCVMLIYPAADFVQQEQFRKKASEKPMSTINMNRAWFGQEDPGDEALAEASPARNVTKDCPPVFLTAARDDDLVDAACSLNMAMALQSAGVPYEHMYE